MANSNSHGGARKGAGRKPKRETHEKAIKVAEKRCADRLPQSFEILEEISEGGREVEEKVYEPAGTLTRERTQIITDDRGNEKAVKVREPAFPDLEPEEMVLVRRTVRVTPPDRAATTYLIDRVMGSPTQRHDFAGMTDEELIEAAARNFGRNGSAGLDAAESDG